MSEGGRRQTVEHALDATHRNGVNGRYSWSCSCGEHGGFVWGNRREAMQAHGLHANGVIVGTTDAASSPTP